MSTRSLTGSFRQSYSGEADQVVASLEDASLCLFRQRLPGRESVLTGEAFLGLEQISSEPHKDQIQLSPPSTFKFKVLYSMGLVRSRSVSQESVDSRSTNTIIAEPVS